MNLKFFIWVLGIFFSTAVYSQESFSFHNAYVSPESAGQVLCIVIVKRGY